MWRRAIRKSSKVFVGMDVHKESIDVTVAEPLAKRHLQQPIVPTFALVGEPSDIRTGKAAL